MTSGWLFDLYPLNNKMVFWIKQEGNGKTIRLEDNSWSHSIYIASDCNSYLQSIVDSSDGNDNNSISSLIRDYVEFIWQQICPCYLQTTFSFSLLER